MTISAMEVAAAFNQQNDKSNWKATCAGELVHFSPASGMAALIYDAHPDAGTFQVKFNRFQGAWGDYVQAVRRGLFTVLHTLKSAGLPFDCAPTVEEMAVAIFVQPDGETRAEWGGAGNPYFTTAQPLPPII